MFEGTRSLRESYPVSYDIQGYAPHTGILLTNHQSLFDTGGEDLFQGLQFGIRSDNSNLLVSGSRFVNMIPQAVFAPLPWKFKKDFFWGSGIYASGSSVVTVDGALQTETEFSNCQYGVVMKDGALKVNDSEFDNVGYGIRLQGQMSGENKITGCRMDAKEAGVHLFMTNPKKLTISDNLFTYRTDEARGILVSDFQLSQLFKSAIISRNTFENEGNNVALDVYGAKEYDVLDNVVYFSEEPTNTIGIDLKNSVNNLLSCNHLYSLPVGGNPEDPEWLNGSGIRVDHSSGNILQCNEFVANARSLFFNGSSENADLKGNTSSHDVGLYLTGGTIIGQQNHHGNEWYPFLGIEAIFNESNEVLIDESKFRVSGSSYLPDWQTLIGNKNSPGSAPWFEQLAGTEYSCPVDVCLPINLAGRTGDWTTTDSLLAIGDTLLQSAISDGTWWNALLHLRNRIENGFYITVPSEGQSFLSSFATSDAGELATGLDLAQEYFIVDSAYSEMIGQRQFQHDSLVTLTRLINETHANGESTVVLDSLMVETLASFASAQSTWPSLDSMEVDRLSQQLGSWEAQLGTSVTAVPDVNMQTLLQSWHDYLEPGDTLSSTFWTTIGAIANQCPEQGGAAVHLARSLMQHGGLKTWNDSLLCQSAGPRSVNILPESDRKVIVRPNPAHGQVMVSLSDRTPITQVNILDQTGRIVKSLKGGDQSLISIDLHGIPPSIYLIEVMNSSGQKLVGRVVVQ
ncbi:MAG: right-handed parallel beta-helix repeat-containing protein [Saprospiraceae bacterium]|nr:right-handed parallel beta-helix repeat-containing protein [Saprospiraceae bacterium]